MEGRFHSIVFRGSSNDKDARFLRVLLGKQSVVKYK